MRTKTEIEADIKVLEAERQDLFAKQKPINDALIANYGCLERAKDELADLLAKDGELDNIEYLIVKYNPNGNGKVFYKALQKWARDHGLMQSGYNPETNQPVFQIAMKANVANTQTTIDALRIVVPLLKPMKEIGYDYKAAAGDPGYVFVDIFEHTLSQYYSYYMYVRPDCSEAVIVTHHQKSHFPQNPMFRGTLETAIEFAAKRLWYTED